MRLVTTRTAVLISIFCAFLLTACATRDIAPPVDGGRASETALFQKGERAFQSKNYRSAISKYNAYLDLFPEGEFAGLALMREAEIYRAWKDYRTARKVYRFLVEHYGRRPEAGQAQVEILRTFYDEGEWQEVVAYANRLIQAQTTRKDDRIPMDQLYLIVGDAFMAMGRSADAVYFYAKARESGTDPVDSYTSTRMETAIADLDSAALESLSARVRDPWTRGYLMYQTGVKEVESGRPADAARTLSRFVVAFPDHEMTPRAREILENTGERSPDDSATWGRTIGCLLPLTGAYQVYGNRALRGVELAMGETGVRSGVNLVVKDTASLPGRAVSGVEELIREGASVIIGPILTAAEAARAAQDFGVPIITLTQKDGVPAIGDFVFRNFITPRMQVRAVVGYAMEVLGLTRFAALYPDEKYGGTFMALFSDEVAARGGIVLASTPYSPEQTDFRDPIENLMRQGPFEALFIPDAPAKTGLILPQLAFYNLRGSQLLGTNLWHSEKLLQLARRHARGSVFPDVFFVDSPKPEVQRFVTDFTRNYGEKPGFIEALAYDTALMALSAFRLAGDADPLSIQSALASMPVFRGVTGPTRFDDIGDAVKQLFLLRIEDNIFVEILR